MTLLLKQLFGFIKLLHSENGNAQIAWGVALGFILGMTPSLSLQSLLVFLLLFLFRIQIGAALISAFFFKFIAFILDPAFDSLGSTILETQGFQSLFTTLYNMPIVPYTRFNNSIVMGSGIISLVLAPFIFLTSKVLINKYRSQVVERFKQSKIFKAWKATSFYKWYFKFDQYYG